MTPRGAAWRQGGRGSAGRPRAVRPRQPMFVFGFLFLFLRFFERCAKHVNVFIARRRSCGATPAQHVQIHCGCARAGAALTVPRLGAVCRLADALARWWRLSDGFSLWFDSGDESIRQLVGASSDVADSLWRGGVGPVVSVAFAPVVLAVFPDELGVFEKDLLALLELVVEVGLEAPPEGAEVHGYRDLGIVALQAIRHGIDGKLESWKVEDAMLDGLQRPLNVAGIDLFGQAGGSPLQ
mmetsp:Transcript_11226/g.20608  ORF Transcript_11226/g.20608 Transcript_11226/m.20608 type:complete len:239 (+) Transcript_11226:705-1421(+)